MPRLARDQETAFRRVAGAAAAGLPPERLGHALLAAIQIAIPVDGYRLFGMDPGTHLINRVIAASTTDGWARLEWLQTVYLAYGRLAYVELSNLIAARIPVAAFQERQETSWGYPREILAPVPPDEHYRLFHTMNSPAGGGVQAEFQAHGRTIAAVQIYRRDAGSPFRATDVAFLRLLRPVIGAALGASLDRERALRTAPAGDTEATGVLMLTPAGGVSFATPAGERWADRLRAAEGAADGPLPTAILTAMAKLRTAPGGSPAAALTVDSIAGPVRVEATPAGDGDGGGTAVVLSPVRPPAVPEIPVTWPLTPQEREVVTLVLRGAGNHAVAATLSIGEHTVETHLRHAYEKLDVRGRGGLLSRFFHENFATTLETPDLRSR